MSVDDNREVSLLIGANYVRALETREVISSQNGGPYAFKTPWPMINQTKAGKFGCNRIMLASTDTVKPGRHYFTVPTNVRKTSIKNLLKKIYKHNLWLYKLDWILIMKIYLKMTGCFYSWWKEKLSRLMDIINFLLHWMTRN